MGHLFSNEVVSSEEKRKRVFSMYDEYCEQLKMTEDAQISVEGLLDAKKKGQEVVLVDTRYDGEQSVSMMEGAISQSAFETLRRESGSTWPSKEAVIGCYCTIGLRSGKFVQKLREEEGLQAYNIKGSILGWIHSDQPLVCPEKDSQQTKSGAHGPQTTQVHTFGAKWDLAPDGYRTVQFTRLI